MGFNEIELEEQLKEAGNRLLDPPSSIDDLLNMLDKLERLLINVDQAPSRSMQDALLPTMKALISNALLRNSDVEVKVSVASCLSEITRITAPNAPYNDDHMKEIFQLFVASMEKLSHVPSRSCSKAALILETIAKVRSCLLMLDLELDELMINMFQDFLKIIGSNHSQTVFLSMETIMTIFIDESDDISAGLLTSLLASVRKDNQSVSPTAWKLGEKVITNCAAKLKPYLKEALQSENVAKDDYAPIVAFLCGDKSHNFEHDHGNGSGDHLVTERLSTAASPGEVFQAINGISNSLSNRSGSTRDVANGIQNNSSKILQRCSSIIQKSESTDAIGNGDPAINLERAPENFPRKRGWKPNSLMNPEEGYDHCWISKGRKTAKLSSGRKPCNKGIDLQSENIVAKKEILALAHATELAELLPNTDGVSGESQPKRCRAKRTSTDTSSLRLDEEELNTENEKPLSEDEISLRKLSEGRNNEEMKQDLHSKKIQGAAKSSEEISLPSDYVSDGNRHGLEGKPLLKSTKRKLTNISSDSSMGQEDIRKRKLARGISDIDVTEASRVRKIKSSDTDGSSKKENPKTNLKKKRTPRKEVQPLGPDIGPELVGSGVRVWWPLDSKFYEAVIESYDHITKKHRVFYTDGDEEILNLKEERWELIGDAILCDKEVKTDTPKPGSSSDKPRKGKGSAKSELGKQPKVKAKSGSTGCSTRDVDKTRNNSTTPGTSLEGGSKPKNKRGVKIEQITPENSNSSDDVNSKGGNEFCYIVKPSTGRSEKEKEEYAVWTEQTLMKSSTSRSEKEKEEYAVWPQKTLMKSS